MGTRGIAILDSTFFLPSISLCIGTCIGTVSPERGRLEQLRLKNKLKKPFENDHIWRLDRLLLKRIRNDDQILGRTIRSAKMNKNSYNWLQSTVFRENIAVWRESTTSV